MTDLSTARVNLAGARSRRDTAAAQLAIARARLADIERQLAAARRTGDRERIAALDNQRRALSDQIAAGAKQQGDLRASATTLLGTLTALADPTKQIAELSDRTPILMFPVRIETRFHSSFGRDGGPVRELWIRIYPDDCQIDGFEPLLSDAEVANATAFWIATWRAGGVDAQERGAWSALVGGSGSGRAAYVISQFAPTNPADRPAKANPDDIVLVIVPQLDVTPTEQVAAFAYWRAAWAANGDAGAIATARANLGSAVGAARADSIVAGFAPDPNGWDPPSPKTRAQVASSCAVLRLPPPPVSTKTTWTRAPVAACMPDRFVALLWTGTTARAPVIGNPIPDNLATAPDPSLAVGDQISLSNDDLVLNDDLVWVADFAKAVDVGMGFRIPLTAAEAQQGFDRLVVVGLRISADERDGKQALQALIAHQLASKAGYGLVPQGSPTNNTDAGGAAHTWVDDPDASFDIVFRGTDAYALTADPLARRDGEWLATALGIDDAIVKQVPHAAGTDQLEARAMNIALWNGTLGYALEEMFAPVFAKADIAATRQFFTQFVSGRGPLPAVRVGNQPYGVLPALAFSRYRSARDADYLQRLYSVLSRMSRDWLTMAANVSHVGGAGDPHQTLLDIVGLHPGSVEYHQRYAESLDQLYNKLTLEGGSRLGDVLAVWLSQRGTQLLQQLGADPDAKPPILEKFFYGASPLLGGPIVDDIPLSETKPIREYTPDHKNYIQWLATSSLDVIRRQDFSGNPEPTALLYLMLRHAMMLGHWDAGLRFLESKSIATQRLESPFIHVQAAAGDSKLAALVKPQPAITGDTTTTLADYVFRPSVLATAPETIDLRTIVSSLAVLAGAPTARLERVFADHVDVVTYRLDAWKTGLAAARLDELRSGTKDPGIYLGAFGWLENLRPKTAQLSAVRLDSDVAATFARAGDAPLQHDPQNAGYIHAPSLNQAAAAAILKNAYRVNASPASPDTMAVNLTSTRVRQALAILEGVRNGQTLAALLGYRFERGLHDEHALAEVDKFIYPLREVFPLVANQLAATKQTADITLLEARNVIDGGKLVDRVITTNQRNYPFGIATGTAAGQLPPATTAEAAAIDAEVDRLLDLNDAIADLVMAESVYQVVLGNFDRAAANQKAMLDGGHPPDIQIVDTPRSGLALEHRVALHVDPTVDPLTSPSSVPMTPRASAEAPLAAWIADRVPMPDDVVATVTYSTPVVASQSIVVTMTQLGVQPIDLMYFGDLELDQAMAELDDRIVQVVRYGADAHPAMAIAIAYTTPVAGKVTFFELAALLRSVRTIALRSRTIRPPDMALPLEGHTVEGTWNDGELATRLGTAITQLTQRRDALIALETDASPLDDYIESCSAELLRTALHGIPQTGTGQLHGDVRAIYQAIAAKVKAVVDRWTKRQIDYATIIASLPGLASDADRLAALKRAELLVVATGTASPPPLLADYQSQIAGAKTTFDGDLAEVSSLLAWSGASLVEFAVAVTAVIPTIALHDTTPFSIDDQTAAMTAARATLVTRVQAVRGDVAQRLIDASAAIANTAVSGEDRINLLVATAKRVLGDEIKLIPRFRLPADVASELANAAGGSADLLTDLRTTRRFPVDDWLSGVARVRPKLTAWQNIVILGEAMRDQPSDLLPLQLPFVANDRWTGLEFDTANASPGDRLLYTGCFASPFAAGSDQCGLVVDEWPELVPVADTVSGVTFHFDRPSSQPPQVMLLALPAVVRGRWNWDDLVATLTETLDTAKARAVEPSQIDASAYAQLLPATVMAVTLYAITIATNLAQNNRIYELLGGA